MGETPPKKLKLSPGSLAMSIWEFRVPTAEGIYQVDVLLNSSVAWRGFFHVVK